MREKNTLRITAPVVVFNAYLRVNRPISMDEMKPVRTANEFQRNLGLVFVFIYRKSPSLGKSKPQHKQNQREHKTTSATSRLPMSFSFIL